MPVKISIQKHHSIMFGWMLVYFAEDMTWVAWLYFCKHRIEIRWLVRKGNAKCPANLK